MDRTKYTEEIFNEIKKLSERDLRVGQTFEIIRGQAGDLFSMENYKLLELLKNLNASFK